jgi:hypothetical protein
MSLSRSARLSRGPAPRAAGKALLEATGGSSVAGWTWRTSAAPATRSRRHRAGLGAPAGAHRGGRGPGARVDDPGTRTTTRRPLASLSEADKSMPLHPFNGLRPHDPGLCSWASAPRACATSSSRPIRDRGPPGRCRRPQRHATGHIGLWESVLAGYRTYVTCGIGGAELPVGAGSRSAPDGRRVVRGPATAPREDEQR